MLTIVFFASKEAKEPVTEVTGIDGSLLEFVFQAWRMTESREFTELLLRCFFHDEE